MSKETLPGITTRAMRYSRAVRRWVAAGRPVRSEEDVQNIFEIHCKTCEQYDQKKEACVICGCRVRRRGLALLNKIRMATEGCPLGMWQADDKEEADSQQASDPAS